MQPLAAAFGANSAETDPPGENNPICALEKSNSDKSSTIKSVSRKFIFLE